MMNETAIIGYISTNPVLAGWCSAFVEFCDKEKMEMDNHLIFTAFVMTAKDMHEFGREFVKMCKFVLQISDKPTMDNIENLVDNYNWPKIVKKCA